MSTDPGTTRPCSLPVGGPRALFFSHLFSNSLIIHEADISARRVQRVKVTVNFVNIFVDLLSDFTNLSHDF